MKLKEVIDIGTGDRYGFIGDAQLDPEEGTVKALIIYGRLRLWGLLGREDDFIVPWQSIQRIGEDTVLVDGTQVWQDVHPRRGRSGTER